MAEHDLRKTCLLAQISGQMQGVGFRYYTQREAARLGIDGWVRNMPDGSVEACIVGMEPQLTTMKQWLQHGPLHASVEHIEFSSVSVPQGSVSSQFDIR